jgi:lipopolysaccharide biosynthesis protein
MMSPKFIAFFLTQFHPTPENDEWWGKGFTEWTNVTKAAPLFDTHYQPHLPTDLGFYDLRLKETRLDQIAMAKQYGIEGFCYHYYWFSGKRILNAPLDAMLADSDHDMPFCLSWANENWTRRWDAADHHILVAQKYLPNDDLNFIKSLIPFFQDSRYIRLDGKPFLIVYRPQHLPDARKTISIWREHCRSIGIGEIYLAAALSHGNVDYAQYGFDSGVEFPPHNLRSANKNEGIDFHAPFSGNAMQYSDIAQSYIDRKYDAHCSNVFRAVFPSWDNTARTGSKALVTLNGTPENYEYWLAETVRRTQNDFPGQERFVFINAWNEWAEGCHLEPDRVYGHAFLEATRRVRRGESIADQFTHQSMPIRKVIADETKSIARTLKNDLRQVLEYHGPMKVNKLRTEASRRPWMKLLLLPVWRLLRRIFNFVRS